MQTIVDQVEVLDWIFASADQAEPSDYITRERLRFLALTPDQQTAERAADDARDEREYREWLAAGAPNPLEDLIEKRAAQRVTAESEWDALHKWIGEGDDDATDEQVTDHDARVADWHRRYDHLWSAARLTRPRVAVLPPLSAGMPMPANLAVVPTVPAAPLPNLIKSSAEFVANFVPPEYLVDGVLQRRFCYSITAQTGVGKTTVAMRIAAHVAAGRALGTLDVTKGSVLYFAGENPTDIQMRWLGLTQAMGLDPATADVHFIPGAMPLSTVADRITAEVIAKGLQPALVVVDTAAAYFEGDNENDNTQAVEHARRMRSLTGLPGGPCVLVLAHPTKRAGEDDLIPRGGGAFLAEVDGNIALQKRESLVVASAQGKFRGREFPPLSFELQVVLHPVLKDIRGRSIPTIVAMPVGEGAAAAMETRTDRDTEMVLRAVSNAPGATPTDFARSLGWIYGPKGEPNRMRAKRILGRLAKEKMVVERLGRWRTTPTGAKELNAIDLARQAPRVTE
jgi:hypothetical protein